MCCAAVKEEWLFAAKDFNGKIMHCLREHYAVAKDLSSTCTDQVRVLIRESAFKFHLEPVLRSQCRVELETHCQKEIENPVFLGSAIEPPRGMEAKGAVLALLDQSKSMPNYNKGKSIEAQKTYLNYVVAVQKVESCLKTRFAKGLELSGDCKKEVIRLLSESRADIHVDPLLFDACQADLKALCEGVPLGFGKQMNCLLAGLEDTTGHMRLTEECAKQLRERRELWQMADADRDGAGGAGGWGGAGGQPLVGNVHQLAQSVAHSPARTSLLAFLAVLVALIFLCGLCCGRLPCARAVRAVRYRKLK